MDPVTHFEIPVAQGDRAQQFYQSVFGWKLTPSPVPGMDGYILSNTTESDAMNHPTTPGAINGTLVPREGTAQHPIIVMRVASLAETLAKAAAAGGSVVQQPYPIGTMGTYARIADADGNVLGVVELAA